MDSSTFIPALKRTLQILNNVKVGIQYHSITNKLGRKPSINKENPPVAINCLDIDKVYALVYQAHAASLWRKNFKRRLPNGVQLQLVPCFTAATGNSMTDTQNAKTLTKWQYYFVKEHLQPLPPYYFISQQNAPTSTKNPITLQWAIMSRAPSKHPSSHLIHNVDTCWNQPSKHYITSVVGQEVKAQ
jgi:hypothetical protein